MILTKTKNVLYPVTYLITPRELFFLSKKSFLGSFGNNRVTNTSLGWENKENEVSFAPYTNVAPQFLYFSDSIHLVRSFLVTKFTEMTHSFYFSNVFNEVELHSYQIWKYQYYNLVMEYNKHPPLATPFAFIFHLVEFVRWLVRKCRKHNKVSRKLFIFVLL